MNFTLGKEYRILVNGVLMPANIHEWGRWFSNPDNRRVGEDVIGDVRVSTVCLGSDHSFGGGEPLWFETMIFGGEYDEYMWRYSTLEQAKAGHARVVDAVKNDTVGDLD